MRENLKYWKMLSLHISRKEIIPEQESKFLPETLKRYVHDDLNLGEWDNNNNGKINDHSISREVSTLAILIFEQYSEGDWYSMTYL